MKKVAVLTSGGDCAGLNACLRSITKTLSRHSVSVLGIPNGTEGLLSKAPPLDLSAIPDFMWQFYTRQNGTLLGALNTKNPERYPNPDGSFTDRSSEIIERLEALGVQTLIATGGDGSHKILSRILRKSNIRYIAIPKTIDNDIKHTQSLGFSSAVDTCVDALDKLWTTASSHHRVTVLEVMGRDAGHIALESGLAGGADIILLPELPFSFEAIIKEVERLFTNTDKKFVSIVMAESAAPHNEVVKNTLLQVKKQGVSAGQWLARALGQKLSHEVRAVVLGHLQRGGPSNARDRHLATLMGSRAATVALKDSRENKLIAFDGKSISVLDLKEEYFIDATVDLTSDAFIAAKEIGVFFGRETKEITAKADAQ